MVPLDGKGDLERRTDGREAVGALEYFSTGVLSLVMTAFCLTVIYGWVVALVEPLHVLSTTALMVAFLAIWAAAWLLLEIAWGWQNGRLSKT